MSKPEVSVAEVSCASVLCVIQYLHCAVQHWQCVGVAVLSRAAAAGV